MLRSIRSTAFLGTLLIAGAASAQTKPAKAAATDDSLIESGKPGAVPVPAAEGAAPVAVPAPPPPADDEGAAEEPAAAPRKRTLTGAGLSTQSTSQGGGADLGDSSSEKDWGFKFKGFFRGPMRIGIDTSGNLVPNSIQLHAPPATPDGNYTRWAYTNISPGPWAEMLFQYGNQRVMMTTSIASYNITSGGWRELQDQLGIDRAFLTMKFPEALGNAGGMAFDVGVFSNIYGAAGKYDAGEYETYLIGRTRIAGATATADIEASDDVKLIIEGGGGAKIDQMYQRYAGSNAPTYDYPSWVPYPGQNVQQGTNVLLHLHAGLNISGMWTVTGHLIDSFVKDARWNVGSSGGTATRPSYANAPGSGHIMVAGLDLKLNGGWAGDGYLGYSYVDAKNAGTVSDSIELLHSQGGWQLAQNYFPDGNGKIHSIAGQYTFSFAAFAMRPRPFWGQAADITIRPFFMWNMITGASNDAYNIKKLKGGVDTIYSFMPMMAAGVRLDAVQPDMNDSTKSFYVISPKLIFRSEFVTHEMVVLQYSYYAYGGSYTDPTKSDSVMPWPYGQYGTWAISKYNSPPDKHVLTLYANMWW